jgi:small-conductance mechanosensitive channel
MKQAQHCALCNHERRSFEIGLTCGLTNEKPSFRKKCDTIEFGDKFAELLESKCFEYESLNREKLSIYAWSVIKIALGVLLILKSYPLANSLGLTGINSSYVWVYVTLIAAVGILLILSACRKLLDFNTNLRKARNEKSRIDRTISHYGIEYDITYDFSKDEFGNRQVDIKCEIIKP